MGEAHESQIEVYQASEAQQWANYEKAVEYWDHQEATYGELHCNCMCSADQGVRAELTAFLPACLPG
jgi:hypothetical protein